MNADLVAFAAHARHLMDDDRGQGDHGFSGERYSTWEHMRDEFFNQLYDISRGRDMTRPMNATYVRPTCPRDTGSSYEGNGTDDGAEWADEADRLIKNARTWWSDRAERRDNLTADLVEKILQRDRMLEPRIEQLAETLREVLDTSIR